MGNTVLNWLIGVMFVVFAVIVAVAGWGLITSGGNQTALSAAKSKFTNAIIGLIIVLAAWLIVDTIMRGLVTGGAGEIEGFGPWSQIECVDQPTTEWVITEIDTSRSGTDTFIGPNQASGPAGSVVASPGGSTCFPGRDGRYDGGRPDSDDVCISNSELSGSDYNLPDGSRLGYTAPVGYFGPETIAANPQISPNFRLCDVTNCDASRRRGDYVYIDPYMVQQLEGVRNDLGGFRVNSGYRSPAYNQGVGGATHSRHQYGDAVDIAVSSGNSQAAIQASCRARGATNIYTYASGAHVHCDWRGANRNN